MSVDDDGTCTAVPAGRFVGLVRRNELFSITVYVPLGVMFTP